MGKKRILVAPLNWGLGHASRCMPIIEQLEKKGIEPVLGGDAKVYDFFQKVYPKKEIHLIPDIQIHYSDGGSFLLHMAKQLPKMRTHLEKEKSFIQSFVEENQIDGIISDNRYGLYSPSIPSVLISHQINLKAGPFSALLRSYLKSIIKKFSICWIPDFVGADNLSAELSHGKPFSFTHDYIGPLSAMGVYEMEKEIDLLIVLSGPEPKRTAFENRILQQLNTFQKKTIIVRGLPGEHILLKDIPKNCEVFQFLSPPEIANYMNQAKVVLCRSGYSSIMDLYALNKKAILVPTPGQTEQEYLAKYHLEKGLVHCTIEDQLDLNHDWEQAFNKSGFHAKENTQLEQAMNKFLAFIDGYE